MHYRPTYVSIVILSHLYMYGFVVNPRRILSEFVSTLTMFSFDGLRAEYARCNLHDGWEIKSYYAKPRRMPALQPMQFECREGEKKLVCLLKVEFLQFRLPLLQLLQLHDCLRNSSLKPRLRVSCLFHCRCKHVDVLQHQTQIKKFVHHLDFPGNF